jgi:hypothetical protein
VAVIFRNCAPSELIAAFPHAVYRVVIGRTFESTVSYLVGYAKWPAVVVLVIDNSAGAAGFPIGSPEKTAQVDDTVATLDYLAGSHAGSATVAELVRQVDSASRFAEVRSVERLAGGVPKQSDGGAVALDASRDAAQEAARTQAESETFTARLGAGLVDVSKFGLGVAGLVALGVLVFLLRKD